MIQKIKNNLLVLASLLTMAVPVLVPTAAVYAENCDSNIANKVADGASGASGDTVTCNETGVGSTSITNLARQIVNIFSIIVGAVAVIMIIYGGFRYITSGGDSNRVGGAKNTLIYAIIGLIIVALAQLIVHFVLNQTNNITTT
jgi:hypothetical protein